MAEQRKKLTSAEFMNLFRSGQRDFSNLDLTGVTDWVGLQVFDANFEGTDFSGLKFAEVLFEEVNLKDAIFANARFEHVVIEESDLSGVDFREASIEESVLRDCCLNGADFGEAHLADVLFEHIDQAEGVNYWNTTLSRVTAEWCGDMGFPPSFAARQRRSRADETIEAMRGFAKSLDGMPRREAEAYLKEHAAVSARAGFAVRTRHEKLQEQVKFLERQRKQGQMDFCALDFSYADLSGMDLADMDFSRCDFVGAKLDGAILKGTRFHEADMVMASVCGAFCAGTDFGGARLEEADFSGARLKKASFRDSALREAQFRGAVIEDCDFGGARGRDIGFDDDALRAMVGIVPDYRGVTSEGEERPVPGGI